MDGSASSALPEGSVTDDGVWLDDADLAGMDLREAFSDVPAHLPRFLSRVNLAGADLSGLNLNGFVLCGANLTGANLRGVTAGYPEGDDETAWPAVDLSGADLTGACLAGSTLRRTSFRTAILRDVDWIGADVKATPEEGGCDLTGAAYGRRGARYFLEQCGAELAKRVFLALQPNPLFLHNETQQLTVGMDDEDNGHMPPWTTCEDFRLSGGE